MEFDDFILVGVDAGRRSGPRVTTPGVHS